MTTPFMMEYVSGISPPMMTFAPSVWKGCAARVVPDLEVKNILGLNVS